MASIDPIFPGRVVGPISMTTDKNTTTPYGHFMANGFKLA
jgi:hypothetical protein